MKPAETRVGAFEIAAWLFVLLMPVTDFPVGAIGLMALLASAPFLLLFRRQATVPRPVLWLALIGTYQLASAVILGMPWSNLLAFEFYRRDAKFFIAYLPMVIATLLLLDRRTVVRMLTALVLVGAAIAAFGIAEYTLAQAGMRLGVMVRGSRGFNLTFHGISESHNAVAGFYAVLVAYTYGQILAGRWRGRGWWTVLVLLGLGLVLTLSRAFILASLVVFGAATVLWGGRRVLLAAAVFLVVMAPFAGGGLARRFVELRNPEEVRNVQVRFEYWVRAAGYIGRSPWLGIGYSRFNDVPEQRFDGIPGVLQWKVGAPTANNDAHAHNALLMIWAETGVLGLALWGLFLGSMAMMLRRRYRSPTAPSEVRGLSYGAVMAFGVILVASGAALNIVTPSSVWPAGFFAGALLSLPFEGPAPRDRAGVSRTALVPA